MPAQPTSRSSVKGTAIPTRESLRPGRETLAKKEVRDDEKMPEEAFDDDFDQLKEVADSLASSGATVVDGDGIAIEVNSNVIEKITLRKLDQEPRFEAKDGYPNPPRYEIEILYASEDGNMADVLSVTLDEIFRQPIDVAVRVIKDRLLEAHRASKNDKQTHRVWAHHYEKFLRDEDTIVHEVESDGEGVKKRHDYDRLVEIEVKKAIDAIRTAMTLKQSAEKIKMA